MLTIIKNNIYIIISIILVILMVSTGFLYMNTKLLNKDIESLKVLNKTVENALIVQNSKIKNYIDVTNSINEIVNNHSLNNIKVDQEIKKMVNNVNSKDLKNISIKKPKLLENVINKAIIKEKRELEEISK